eukprot:scaffold63336_cov28-Prasinocladus_malaysianus.AAC.1
MGVNGLLTMLGELCFEGNLYQRLPSNAVLGIDASVWLHHFAYWQAEDIVKRGCYKSLATR